MKKHPLRTCLFFSVSWKVFLVGTQVWQYRPKWIYKVLSGNVWLPSWCPVSFLGNTPLSPSTSTLRLVAQIYLVFLGTTNLNLLKTLGSLKTHQNFARWQIAVFPSRFVHGATKGHSPLTHGCEHRLAEISLEMRSPALSLKTHPHIPPKYPFQFFKVPWWSIWSYSTDWFLLIIHALLCFLYYIMLYRWGVSYMYC